MAAAYHEPVTVQSNPAAIAGQIDPTMASAVAEGTSEGEIFKGGDICPSCGVSSLVYEEGCSKCYSCGHSEC